MSANHIVGRWTGLKALGGRSYTCGHCGALVGSDRGYGVSLNDEEQAYIGDMTGAEIRICMVCNRPTLLNLEEQQPAPLFGQSVAHLPEAVNVVYAEVRRCVAAGVHTAAAILGRKLLAAIAVERGADANLTFKQYVHYLASRGYVAAESERWVDHIRDKGNEAAHEIVPVSPRDAKRIVYLVELLLRQIYEAPAVADGRDEPPPPPPPEEPPDAPSNFRL